jgi:hypothetical protein
MIEAPNSLILSSWFCPLTLNLCKLTRQKTVRNSTLFTEFGDPLWREDEGRRLLSKHCILRGTECGRSGDRHRSHSAIDVVRSTERSRHSGDGVKYRGVRRRSLRNSAATSGLVDFVSGFCLRQDTLIVV